MLPELAQDAGLNDKAAAFVRNTAILVKERGESQSKQTGEIRLLTSTAPEMRKAREAMAFGNDLFWISQLYTKDWEPGPTF